MKLQKSDTTLNEQDAITDMLESEKQLVGFYATALFEGNSKSMRKSFTSHLSTVAENQYCLYSQLLSRGYVQPAPAQKQQIDALCDTYKKRKKQLSAK